MAFSFGAWMQSVRFGLGSALKASKYGSEGEDFRFLGVTFGALLQGHAARFRFRLGPGIRPWSWVPILPPSILPLARSPLISLN